MPNPPIASVQWRRISSKFLVTELIRSLIVIAACCIPLLLVSFFARVAASVAEVPWPVFAAAAVPVAFAVIGLISSLFRVRSTGWALREDDFLVRRGVMFRRVIAVPYGRMQLVDVKQGPFQRMFGLASVELVTAAASTQASLPGLERDEADRLRDHLVGVAETRRAGL